MLNRRGKFDLLSVAGLMIAGWCLWGALFLEAGDLRDLGQTAAALVVIGGTLGAVMMSFPATRLKHAVSGAFVVFRHAAEDPREVLDYLIECAQKSRRTGVVSLDAECQETSHPFLKKALMLAVDGIDPSAIRDIMETDLVVFERSVEDDAKVFESAGGYAPTFGIIGAVLGLIQVMKHLENVDDVGRGIAVSFVATVYGVGLANLILFPVASKIRARGHAEANARELMIDGVVSIQAGKNPRIMRRMLGVYAGPASHNEAGSSVAGIIPETAAGQA